MKTTRRQPIVTTQQFCRPNLLTISIAIVSFFALSGLLVQGDTIIQNFNGFADSAALNLNVSAPTANATITLGATDGVGGSQSLHFQGANGSSPFFSKFTLAVTPFMLTGLSAVTVQAEFISGSNEKLKIELLDSTQTTMAVGSQINTQTFPTTSYTTYTIPTDNLTSTITGIRFTYAAVSFGTTVMTFDNIATVDAVPEPSTFAMIGLGFATLLVWKRQTMRQ